MGFEQYRQTLTPFDRYYDLFLQNSFAGKRFRITLRGGATAVGLPTSGSMANPSDPNVTFNFRSQDGAYRIPFRELESAEEMVQCGVRTVSPHAVGGSDFIIYVAESEADSAVGSEGQVSVIGELATNPRFSTFVDSAPPGTYKFLTVGGTDFRILSIQREGVRSIKVAIERI